MDKDDRTVLTEIELAKLDKLQQFEHKFPFYLMDVNGFVMHLKEAMKMENPDMEFKEIKQVNLKSL